MDFHAEFFPAPFDKKIRHSHKILLAGSCFTEQIGHKLAQHKFETLQNPNGILFNPVSIAEAVLSYVQDKEYTENDLFYFNELWSSWHHHSRFSGIDKLEALKNINHSQHVAHAFLKKADWLMVTLGSAFVYETAQQEGDNIRVVANCHKVPTDKFNRRLLSVPEIEKVLSSMIEAVQAFNPAVKFIFTISPVRHLREGFIENNRSKAALMQAVHMLANNESVFYFPAYELVIDDLRDYRFYAEDMVHPNYAATNYVWEKFVLTCIEETDQKLMKEIAVIIAAKNHKAFNPTSEQHKKFMQTSLDKLMNLKEKYSYIDFAEELSYFKT